MYAPKLDLRERHFRIPWEHGLSLFLRYLGPAAEPQGPRIVLYVHGATFPSALSVAHRFDGQSWRDELNAAGFEVWGLDFIGYGGSDRYPEMSDSPEDRPALGRAATASSQIERAVEFITDYHHATRISIIGHSWASMPVGLFASRRPELLDRIVFFAPIAQRPKQSEAERFPAWRLVSLQEQRQRFTEDVPSEGAPVLSSDHFDEWGPLYLDTDQESRTRAPASVKVPTGPVQEIAEALAGKLAYDPSSVVAPVAIIRGAWDHLVTDADAKWLFDGLKNSPVKRDVKISRGTHLMHLESSRYALYREAQIFLEGRDQPVQSNHFLSKESLMNRSGSQSKVRMVANDIPGYDYGSLNVAKSPITLKELEELKQSAGFTEEDERWLHLAGEILADQTDELVAKWRDIIAKHPHLAQYGRRLDGHKDEHYSERSGLRFQQWVLDTCLRPYDQDWLNYQQEMAIRHTSLKKNKTDNVQSVPTIHLRHIIAFTAVLNDPNIIQPFLLKKGHSPTDVERMYQAWSKSLWLQIALWSEPYTNARLAPNEW
jgi:pimeloyl-ACP methyl ester carboxylesterase